MFDAPTLQLSLMVCRIAVQHTHLSTGSGGDTHFVYIVRGNLGTVPPRAIATPSWDSESHISSGPRHWVRALLLPLDFPTMALLPQPCAADRRAS